jgi:hypothetical protein
MERMDAVLDLWIRRLEEHRVHMAPIPALRSQLSGWLQLIATLDQTDKDDLLRQVALHARNLGTEGRPASAAIMQVHLLEEALRHAECELSPLRPYLTEMLRVVADAHALGASSRQARNFRDRLGQAPIVTLPGQAVLGFLVGGMQAELIDTVLGRLLRAGAGCDEAKTILDVSAAPRDDETFHRSLFGFASAPEFEGMTLVVCGLEDPEVTKIALQRLKTPEGRLFVVNGLDEALDLNLP